MQAETLGSSPTPDNTPVALSDVIFDVGCQATPCVVWRKCVHIIESEREM